MPLEAASKIENDHPSVDEEGPRQRSDFRRKSLAQRSSRSPAAKAPRRDSVLTDSSFSSRRLSVRSPTEDFFLPRAPGAQEELHQEPTLWHSLPVLALAIIPSIGGVFFKKGSIVITDIALLVMAAIYLNWVLITPWSLYHSAQTIKIAKPPLLETIDEEDNNDNVASSAAVKDDGPASSQDQHADQSSAPGRTQNVPDSAALRELQLHELFALAMCFVGPLLGAYVLQVIRTQISLGDELVSNLHLTLFVLGAELRPMRHSMKLLHARTVHLQRLVRDDPHLVDRLDTVLVQDLMDRVNAIESSVSEVATKSMSSVDQTASVTADSVDKARSVLQTQVDALNRAVRRYEKRATAQTIQNEARLQDLEARLKDALALAAAAASYSQNNGILPVTIDYTKTVLYLPIRVVSSTLRWLVQAVNGALSTLLVRLGLISLPRRKKSVPKQPLYPRTNYGK